MKTQIFKTATTLLCVLTVILTSCDVDGEPDELIGVITATIEGEAPYVSIPSLTETQGSTNGTGTLKSFNIGSFDASGVSLGIWVEDVYEGVGLYDIKDYPNSSNAVRVVYANNENSWRGGFGEKAGELEVISVENNIMKGRFNLIGVSDIDNTERNINGDFEITLNN